MPLCIRFVDETNCIREECIHFSTLVRITGECIAAQICTDLKSLELDIKYVRGQGYDGASSMSSDRTGVQAHIKKVTTCCRGGRRHRNVVWQVEEQIALELIRIHPKPNSLTRSVFQIMHARSAHMELQIFLFAQLEGAQERAIVPSGGGPVLLQR
jgi:hypothetical protein